MQYFPIYTILSILAICSVSSANGQENLNGNYAVEQLSHSIELSDGTGSLQLSRNTCQFSYETNEENSSIHFTIGGCTEVCCDSELDEQFKTQLEKIETYRIQRKELLLFGSDTLLLKKVKRKKVQDDFSF